MDWALIINNKLKFSLYDILLLLLPIILSLVVFYFLYGHVYKPFLELRRHLSLDIREKIIPDIQKVSDSITTLSSAAIIITFTIIQASNLKCFRTVLFMSWIGFVICIFSGIIIGIITYIFRAHEFAKIRALQQWKEKVKEDGDRKDVAVKLSELVGKSRSLQNILFILILVQPLLFFISIWYVVIFAIKNMK